METETQSRGGSIDSLAPVREPSLSRWSDGSPAGAMVYLTAEQLEELGAELEGSDSVSVFIEGGSLHVQ